MSGIERKIARRYARALADLVAEGRDLMAGLARLAEVARQPEMQDFLARPGVRGDAKIAALKKLAGRVPREIDALLALLARRNKLVLLPLIHEETEAIVKERSGEIEAEVTAAVKLSKQQQERLAAALARMTGRKVTLHVRVDPSILGGLVVRIGDRVLDASLRARIEAMRRALLAA